MCKSFSKIKGRRQKEDASLHNLVDRSKCPLNCNKRLTEERMYDHRQFDRGVCDKNKKQNFGRTV